MSEVARATRRLDTAIARLEAGFARLETAVSRKFDRDESEIARLQGELKRVETARGEADRGRLAAADQLDLSIGRLHDLLQR